MAPDQAKAPAKKALKPSPRELSLRVKSTFMQKSKKNLANVLSQLAMKMLIP